MVVHASLLLAVALTVGPDLDPQRAAAIEYEQAKETAAVEAKYGNKKSTELSREERVQMIRDLAAAQGKVLDKYGVSPRDWARAQMARSREEAAQVKEATKALEAKEKAAAAAKENEPGQREITVQRGISDDNPVVLEEREGAAPVVEQGLPPEYSKDQSDLAESEAAGKASEAPASKGGAKR